MIYVTQIRLSPPDSQQHEHITHVRWVEAGRAKTEVITRQEAVDWLNTGASNRLWVRGTPKDSEVLVVDADPPYLRTAADGYYNNNLLSLPRF